MSTIRDKIRGSLIGGAAGDALGYAVEFLDEKSIFNRYGREGIRSYMPDPLSGKAVISDDTQMTLFTAEAMLFREGRGRARGIAGKPRVYVNMTYQDWLLTQEMRFSEAVEQFSFEFPDYPGGIISIDLMTVPELYKTRAPGLTCLSGLRKRRDQRRKGINPQSFIADPINNSKGCGGVMRVAPIGMMRWTRDIEKIALEGAEAAAITHCNSLGYMPAAVLAQMVYRLIFNDSCLSLNEIAEEAKVAATKLFAGDPNIDTFTDLLDEAAALAVNDAPDLENIHRLGEGWVGEEALAIALYCCLRYQDDFSAALIASVNHKGDSDSTGAIAGNIVGALAGYEAIEPKWKERLELHDLIIDIADRMAEFS